MRVLALVTVLIGCAEAPPVHTTLPVHSLKAPEQATQEGVTVSILPITHQSWRDNGQISVKLAWQEIDRSAPVAMGSGASQAQHKTVTDTVPLLPLPAVRVSINNQSQKPLKFGRAHIKLSDGQHDWNFMTSAGDVTGRVQADLMESHSAISDNRGVLDTVSGLIGALPIVTPALSVAPGQTWEGYLCFNVTTHDADEFNAVMDSAEKLTLSIADLDGAPGFSFTLPRETQQKSMTCPGDLKKPSLKKCKEG